MAQNGPNIGQNGPKMAQNGLTCYGKWCIWGQEYQHQIVWPKMVKNCQKMIKNGQNYPKMAQKWPKTVQTWAKMAQKWPKMVWHVKANGPYEARNTNIKLPEQKWWKIAQKGLKNGQNYPKMAENGQKWSKNGPKWSEMLRQMVQMRPGIPTPNCLTKNGEKLQNKYQKMAKMTLKWPKMTQADFLVRP